MITKHHLAAMLEARAQGLGPEVLAELVDQPLPVESDAADPKAAAAVARMLRQMAMRPRLASKSLSETNAWMMLKSNDQPKDYQGRQAGGKFGSGTEGGTKDHKEQELRDRDGGAPRKPESSDFANKVLSKHPDGKPGLSSDKTSIKIGAMDVPGHNIVYRGPDGKPVAAAVLVEIDGKLHAKDFATDKTRGLLASRAAVEVGKEMQRLGVSAAAGTMSPDAAKLAAHASDSSKMQMVHGKRDELSSGLGQTAIGQQDHLATIKNLYDNYKDHTYQQINDSISKIGDSLGSSQLKKLAQDFGVNDSGSKYTVIGAIQRKITDRKASAERVASIGAKPQPQASSTKLPESVSPTIPHKQTGERPEFEGLRLDSKDRGR